MQEVWEKAKIRKEILQVFVKCRLAFETSSWFHVRGLVRRVKDAMSWPIGRQ